MDSNSPSDNLPKPNWPLLAGLRFVLALGVLNTHMQITAPDGLGNVLPLDAETCVFMFFVISGISMAHSYSREPAGFYRRRLFRVMPIYYLGLALAFLPFAIWGRIISVNFGIAFERPGFFDTVKYIFVLQPIFAPLPPVNGALWSLGVEISFYLAVPLIARTPSRWLTVLAILSAVSYIAFGRDLKEGFNPTAYTSFFWPFALGWLSYTRPKVVPKWALAVVPCAVVLISWRVPYLAGLVTTLIPGFLIGYATTVHLTPRLKAVFSWAGDLSFPLYALHSPVLMVMVLQWPTLAARLMLIPCFAVAIAALYLIDRPLRNFGHKRLAVAGSPATASPAIV